MAKPKPNTKHGNTKLTLDPRNARKHSARNLSTIERSLKEVGGGRSILVDGDNIIRAGNGVYTKAKSLGLRVRVVDAKPDELIAVRRTDLRGKQAIRAAVLDNLAADSSAHEYDADILAAIVRDDDVVRALAQDDAAITKLLSGTDAFGSCEEATDAGELVDRAAELQEKWGTATGQIWQLGRHRLIVGDCTDNSVIISLMQNKMANMVFTDPPYGVDYEGGLNKLKRDKLKGDDSGSLYFFCMDNCAKFADENAPCYIWFAGSVGKQVYDAVDKSGFKVRAMIVWNKIDAHYGNFMAQYMQKHEPCLYCVRGSPKWIGASNEVTVWDVKQPSKNEFHPTQKPVELAIRAIKNHDAPIVADWFVGSGTTLIACEELGRECRACEIEPRYASVTIERWAMVTGETPRRVEG